MSKYSTQFKSTAVQDYLKGGSLKRVAELYQVDHSDLRKWVLAYQTHISHSKQGLLRLLKGRERPFRVIQMSTASLSLEYLPSLP